MRALILDDDPASQKLLTHYVEDSPSLDIIGTCGTAAEALQVLEEEKVDLLFLDMELPDKKGLELLKSLSKKLIVIVVTIAEKYAVDAFEFQVADFLVKPVSGERFNRAVAKANEIYQSRFQNSPSGQSIYIRKEGMFHHLPFDEIQWVEALGDYVSFKTPEKSITVHATMKEVETHLNEDYFIRAHRSFIVNLKRIESFDANFLIVDRKEKKMIPIGKSYRKSIMTRLNIL